MMRDRISKMEIDTLVKWTEEWIREKAEEWNLSESEFQLLEVRAYGSRTTGRAGDDSDLDLLISYAGRICEDDLFNMLHNDELTYGGITLDLNPINMDKTGTIDEYLGRCDDEWKCRGRGR